MDHTRTRRSQSRLAYSLLEVIIAVALFTLVMSAVFQAMLGISGYVASAEIQDDLTVEGQRVMAVISEDLVASGWYLPEGQPTLSGVANDRSYYFYPYVQVQYNDATATGLGTRFPHTHRISSTQTTTPNPSAQVTLTHLPGLPGAAADASLAPGAMGTAYISSFYALSQELIFLQVHNGFYNADPRNQVLSPIDFSNKNGYSYDTTANPIDANSHHALGIRKISDWARIPSNYVAPTAGSGTDGRYYIADPVAVDTGGKVYEANVNGIWLRPPTNVPVYAISMPLRWEAISQYPTLTTPTATVPQRVDVGDLREYTYAVVPNGSNNNRGQLVRAYKKPTSQLAASDRRLSTGTFPDPDSGSNRDFAMVVDKVLSDHVDRITFDTFRTDGNLEINQIRVRVFMSRQSNQSINGNAPQHRIVEATVSMRSTTDTEALNSLISGLGSGGSMLLH
jgi:hypothetical protein